jgi:hypothetical protein
MKTMNRLMVLLGIGLVMGPLLGVLLREPRAAEPIPVRPPEALLAPPTAPAPQAPAAPILEPAFRADGEAAVYEHAARTAWEYVTSQYQPGTGLVNSVAQYPFATIWDIGSTLAAFHAAHELEIIDREEFDRKMGLALATLARVPVFDNGAFNKNYQVARGLPAGRNDREPQPGGDGYGWSATDLGRLLIWLRIVAVAHPQHARAAEAVVARIDMQRVVRDGYLWGAERTRRGTVRTYQEGRIGYEQYAAAGFALWGHHADRALSMEYHATPIEVMGVPLFYDTRGEAHLTSEPFLMMGLELGWWSPVWEEMARQLLAAQEARFRQTGRLTMVSEDAVPLAPHYFYYYTIHSGGNDFAVRSLISPAALDGPRWVSTKAAFAWHALEPRPYTWQVVEEVAARAATQRHGWNSGIFEENLQPTGSPNINTAALVLESALYHARRRPLLAR